MRVISTRAALLGTAAAAALFTTPAIAADQDNPNTAPPAASNVQTQTQAAAASEQEIVVTRQILLAGRVVRTGVFAAQLQGLFQRLREGSPPVVGLLGSNPFPDRPPRYVRALLYDYRFADLATHRRTGEWWQRRLETGFCGP